MKNVTGSLESFNLIFKYRISFSGIKFGGKVFQATSLITPLTPEEAG